MPEKLPKGWVKTTLGEVCAINPRSPSYETLPDHTEVSFVPMAAVEEESGRLDSSQIRLLGSVRKGYTPFRENDVIFAKITPCMENGKIALATGLRNGLGYGSTEFVVLRSHEGLLPRFLLYFLLQPSLREQAEHHMTGASGQKRVPTNYLRTCEFLLPPTGEQARIVAKLDAAISKLERAKIAAHRAKERLQGYRAAVLHAALTGQLTHAWREAHRGKIETGQTLLQRILVVRRTLWEETELERHRKIGEVANHSKSKSFYPEPVLPDTDDVPDLPEEWTWASLDQVLSSLRNGISEAPREIDGLPILRISSVRALAVDLKDLSASTATKYKNYALREGDLLFTRYNGSRDLAGVCGRVPSVNQMVVYPDKLIRGVPVTVSEQISSFVAIAANSGASRHYIEAHLFTTAGQWGISGRNLKFTPVPFPPASEQDHIVREVTSRLSAADRLARAVEQQLMRAQAARRSLLDEAFTGRLVQPENDSEPASALLLRFRAEKVQSEAARDQGRHAIQLPVQKKREPMKEDSSTSESLRVAWEKLGRDTDARRLFDEAGFSPDNVVQFYEALRATPDIRTAFQSTARGGEAVQKPAKQPPIKQQEQFDGRFRLIDLWLEDFKNLKDYSVHFNPSQGLDVILGWNGTGKSNLFESLVIIFRDLHEWWEKNRWPEKPMNGFRLSYEMDEHVVEITWQPKYMKRPELKRGPIPQTGMTEPKLTSIKREQLPLPRFVFGYYSGPTNRLAEHFLPMKQDHYDRLRLAKADDAKTLAKLLEQRRFFCAETHHAKYVLLGFSYKEDKQINEFLERRLRIVGFESALFIIRKPLWAKSGSKAEDFWGATGIMRRVMERLRRYAIAPMVLQQKVNYGYRSATEDHYYFFLPDLASLHAFAAEYQDARTFFFWPWRAPISRN